MGVPLNDILCSMKCHLCSYEENFGVRTLSVCYITVTVYYHHILNTLSTSYLLVTLQILLMYLFLLYLSLILSPDRIPPAVLKTYASECALCLGILFWYVYQLLLLFAHSPYICWRKGTSSPPCHYRLIILASVLSSFQSIL